MKLKMLAGLCLTLAAAGAQAQKWNLVGETSEETVFLDTMSVHIDGAIAKARVLKNHPVTATLGDNVYPHKSKVLVYAIDCVKGELGYAQWSLHSADLGTGATVWADGSNNVAFYAPDSNSPEARILADVCQGSAALARY